MARESGLGRAAARGGRRLINYRFIFKLGLIKHYSSLISASGMLPTWAITVFKHAVCPVMCENGIQTIYGERALLPCVCY